MKSPGSCKTPDISLVFCANDMMALGVIQYLKSSKRSAVQVAGFDALAEARQAIREGTMIVTVDQKADMQGYTGILYALKLIRGETVPPETLLDTQLVTIHDVQ
jgi:ribose transport system substrate-binding protein